MGKGEATRQAILDQALSLASALGLEGVTIGGLAEKLGLSKSGLFAHFESKESLQIKVLDNAAAYFIEAVIKPTVKVKRGRPRVQALFDHWLAWTKAGKLPGGCVFFSAASELDDRPGKVRDHFVKLQKEWLNTRVQIISTAVEAGHFKKDLDVEQFAHELYGIMLAHHFATRLIRDPKAKARTETAFNALVERAQSQK